MAMIGYAVALDRKPHYWAHDENLETKKGIQEWNDDYIYFKNSKGTMMADPNDILKARDNNGYAECLICDLLSIKHAIFWQCYPEFRELRE